jgi:hypothetical protein
MTTRGKITIAVLTVVILGLIIGALLGRIPWDFVVGILFAIGFWAVILWSLSRLLRRVSSRTRIIISVLLAALLGAYANYHRPDNTINPQEQKRIQELNRENMPELTVTLIGELTQLRDNIDRGITFNELERREATIRDVDLTIIFSHANTPIPAAARAKVRDVVVSLHNLPSFLWHRSAYLKDLRVKTELAITALSAVSHRQ